MTFETYEESEESGIPVTLYYFKWGSEADNYYAYTDFDLAITYDAFGDGDIAFTPTTIGREKIEQSGGLDNKALEIQVTPNASIVQFYKTRKPAQVVTLTIFAGHYDDVTQDYKVVWTGRVLGVARKGRFATINCEPISTSMRRPGLRRRYQYGCPWVLYSGSCGASEVAATRTATVAAIGDSYLDFNDGWQGAFTPSKFKGGYLQWSDPTDGSLQVETIIDVVEDGGGAGVDRLYLNGYTTGITVGTSCDIKLGCNHQTEDCLNLHNNIVNYGGQRHIPRENPVGYVNRYY